jgi:soluble lytic murein transglycosylase-like protein
LAFPEAAEDKITENNGFLGDGLLSGTFLGDGLPPKLAFLVLNIEDGQDLILAAYRNPELKKDVVAFFHDITGSEEVAEAILLNADYNDIPPALAFALCAEESAYNPRAFNRNRNETMDRGLFQLNSATFPELSTDDFYNTHENARHGMSHFRWCLDTAGTEVAALAMYNAGAGRVSSLGTPKGTLDYVSRILKRERKIEGQFITEYYRLAQERNEKTQIIDKKNNEALRLSLLTPLGWRRIR